MGDTVVTPLEQSDRGRGNFQSTYKNTLRIQQTRIRMVKDHTTSPLITTMLESVDQDII